MAGKASCDKKKERIEPSPQHAIATAYGTPVDLFRFSVSIANIYGIDGILQPEPQSKTSDPVVGDTQSAQCKMYATEPQRGSDSQASILSMGAAIYDMRRSHA